MHSQVSVSRKSFLKGPILLGSGQSVQQLPEALRGPPGAYGQPHPTAHLFEIFDAQWQESISRGLLECATATSGGESDPRCGGSPQSPGISSVVLQGSIQGDLLHRNVPRDRTPAYLHSSVASQTEPDLRELSFQPLVWMHLEMRKCLLPTQYDFQGAYALEKDPAYEDFSHSHRRPFSPRAVTVQTLTFMTASLEECKIKCQRNHACGIVTYEALTSPAGFGCTLSLVPAPTCVLVAGRADQGVLLYPREEITRLTTDAPTSNRKLVFPGERSGVVLTTGNPSDVWGLPNLHNAWEQPTGEDGPTGDIFRHYQTPSVCDGLSTVMPDCTTASMMDRCMKRHYPTWKGMGSMPAGWDQQDPIDQACVKTNERINADYAEALQDNFTSWMRIRYKPYVGVGVVASGYKCRADYGPNGQIIKGRPDLMDVFTDSGFKMPNNDTCSTLLCDTCRPYNQPGKLPEYLDPVTYEPVHPAPASMANRRITFPDASGTVITSGNVEDVVFQSMTLRNVFVDGMVYFGITADPDDPAVYETDESMMVRWGTSNFLQGRLNMLGHTNFRDTSAGIAYGDPALLTPKPSGSITGIVDYQVRQVKVCVYELIFNEELGELEECPFQGGQDACPRRGPFCSGQTGVDQNDQCALPENPEGFRWRGNVLNDDCQSDADCGDFEVITKDPSKSEKCRDSLVCLTGPYAGEACLTNDHCCERGLLTECQHHCHGIEQYKLRPEKGGFHTNYYRNVYLTGCEESPTNFFFCTHNTDGLAPERLDGTFGGPECSNETVLGQTPVCPNGGPACCCDPDGFCTDGTDAWCCRVDCPAGKGTSCTKAQPASDQWTNVEDVVGADMDGLKYTSIGSQPITKINTILLPNVSGTILTTGNLRELPSIFLNITGGVTAIGGHTGFAGDLQFGGESRIGNAQFHSWINGEVGLTFRTSAGCASVVLSGSILYAHAMGTYFLYPDTYHSKPVWKHRSESLFIYYASMEGLSSQGLDRGEGRWQVGTFIGADQGIAAASPVLLKMRHMTFSPIDADLRMPGPVYAGETPGTWEVWLTEGKGRWVVEAELTSACLVPKTTQDHLALSIPRHASKDQAIRQFFRTQLGARSLPIRVEQEPFINYQYQVEQHPTLPNASSINISRCYAVMLSAGKAPNATCAQEHNCFPTEDTRPWSLHTFNNYLDDLEMLQPTLLRGDISVGILQEWTGCVLDGVWTSPTFGSSLSLSTTTKAGELTWSPTTDQRLRLRARFHEHDTNRNSKLSRSEWAKLSEQVRSGQEEADFAFVTRRAFGFLDSDADGELTVDEATSGLATVAVTWDPIAFSSFSKTRAFTGVFTVTTQQTWTSEWREYQHMTHEDFLAEPNAIPSGGRLTASLDEQCRLSLTLVTDADPSTITRASPTAPSSPAMAARHLLASAHDPVPNSFSKVFLNFTDGRQTDWSLRGGSPIEAPAPSNVSSYVYRKIYKRHGSSTGMSGSMPWGSEGGRTHESVNTQFLTWLSSSTEECTRLARLGFQCESPPERAAATDKLAAAARSLFSTLPAGVRQQYAGDAATALEEWRVAMTSHGFGEEGWNSQTSCVISMNLTSANQRHEPIWRLRCEPLFQICALPFLYHDDVCIWICLMHLHMHVPSSYDPNTCTFRSAPCSSRRFGRILGAIAAVRAFRWGTAARTRLAQCCRDAEDASLGALARGSRGAARRQLGAGARACLLTDMRLAVVHLGEHAQLLTRRALVGAGALQRLGICQFGNGLVHITRPESMLSLGAGGNTHRTYRTGACRRHARHRQLLCRRAQTACSS